MKSHNKLSQTILQSLYIPNQTKIKTIGERIFADRNLVQMIYDLLGDQGSEFGSFSSVNRFLFSHTRDAKRWKETFLPRSQSLDDVLEILKFKKLNECLITASVLEAESRQKLLKPLNAQVEIIAQLKNMLRKNVTRIDYRHYAASKNKLRKVQSVERLEHEVLDIIFCNASAYQAILFSGDIDCSSKEYQLINGYFEDNHYPYNAARLIKLIISGNVTAVSEAFEAQKRLSMNLEHLQFLFLQSAILSGEIPMVECVLKLLNQNDLSIIIHKAYEITKKQKYSNNHLLRAAIWSNRTSMVNYIFAQVKEEDITKYSANFAAALMTIALQQGKKSIIKKIQQLPGLSDIALRYSVKEPAYGIENTVTAICSEWPIGDIRWFYRTFNSVNEFSFRSDSERCTFYKAIIHRNQKERQRIIDLIFDKSFFEDKELSCKLMDAISEPEHYECMKTDINRNALYNFQLLPKFHQSLVEHTLREGHLNLLKYVLRSYFMFTIKESHLLLAEASGKAEFFEYVFNTYAKNLSTAELEKLNWKLLLKAALKEEYLNLIRFILDKIQKVYRKTKPNYHLTLMSELLKDIAISFKLMRFIIEELKLKELDVESGEFKGKLIKRDLIEYLVEKEFTRNTYPRVESLEYLLKQESFDLKKQSPWLCSLLPSLTPLNLAYLLNEPDCLLIKLMERGLQISAEELMQAISFVRKKEIKGSGMTLSFHREPYLLSTAHYSGFFKRIFPKDAKKDEKAVALFDLKK